MSRSRILVIDDNRATRELAKSALPSGDYEVVEAVSGDEALSKAASSPPQLILQDLVLPDIDGFELARRLRQIDGLAEIPIIALSGIATKMEEAKLLDAGFCDYLVKPVPPGHLVETVVACLPRETGRRQATAAKHRVLLVDDNPWQRRLVQIELETAGYKVTTATNGAEALEMARQSPPSLILSDILMPHLDGFSFCLAVRHEPGLTEVPVVLLSSTYVEEEDRDLARRVGASGFVVRTSNLHETLEVMKKALGEAPPPTPEEIAGDLSESIKENFQRRVERQAAMTAGLARRCAELSAELAVLSGISEAVTASLEVDQAMNEILSRCLDAGGISMGAVYRLEGETVHLCGQSGYENGAGGRLATFFDRPDLLLQIIEGGEPVLIPSPAIAREEADRLLSDMHVAWILVAPIVSHGERQGALIMASEASDLGGRDQAGFARTVAGQLGLALTFSQTYGRLQASEQRYRALFAGAPEAIVLVGEDGILHDVNPAAEDLLGWRREELVGRSVEVIVPEASRAAHASYRSQYNENPAPRMHERQLAALRKDGSVVPVDIRLSPIVEGGKHYTIANLVDIEDRLAIEQALRESELRFRTAFDEAEMGMAIIDLDSRLEKVNAALVDLLGYSEKELVGHTLEEFTHPDDVEISRRANRKMRKSPAEAMSLEKRYLRKDGTVVWVSAHSSTFRTGAEEPLHFISQFLDITERKQALELLRQSEEKFSKVFTMSPLGITLTTLADGVFLEVNPEFVSLSGYSREELIGKSAIDLGLWLHLAKREELVRRLRKGQGPFSLEAGLRTREGQARTVQFFGSLFEFEGRECLLAAILDISERKVFQAELERQALYDPLTGLPNRTLFRDRLEHALDHVSRNGRSVGVIFLDIDRFKVINDTFGHAVGDELLTAVAQRLEQMIRHQDTFARLGGDEFAGLLENVGAMDEVVPVVERLAAAFEEPFKVAGRELRVSTSLGVTLSNSELAVAEDLLRFSDVAMYAAKREQGTRYHVFNPERDRPETHRLHRETELWRAIENEEFVLFYQPIRSLASGKIIGVEALIRWQHPEEGLIPPGEFIPVAQESGLIVPIGGWVAHNACSQGARWVNKNGRAGFLISLNLSARNFQEPDIVERIGQTLARAGLAPSNLEIELTERALLRGLGRINELRSLGVRIAVDDLGTGYSSLEYLSRLDIDTLKIDRTFVGDLASRERSRAVVEAVLLMGERMGLRVVAEGIETEEELETLRSLGCRYGQGFLLGRPMPATDLDALLD